MIGEEMIKKSNSKLKDILILIMFLGSL